MSDIKTVVVIGTAQKYSGEGDIIDIFESDLFGYNQTYDTAHHFIKSVRDNLKSVGYRPNVTQVVIG